LVHVEGEVSRRGGAYDHGRSVSGGTTREDAMIFDLRALGVERAAGGCSLFLTGVWAGTNEARCHFALNERWLEELRGSARRVRLYRDLESAVAAAEADELRRRANVKKHAALDLTRIILRGGLGPLRFGMTPEQVRALLGDPDWKSDDASEYEDIDLHLTFKDVRERGRCLVELWTENPRVRLLDIPLIGPGLAQTRSLLERAEIKHTSTYMAKGIDWQYFDHGLTLHSFGDTVERVEWTIEKDNLIDEEIDWSGSDQVG
jgi:hypothetical protein